MLSRSIWIREAPLKLQSHLVYPIFIYAQAHINITRGNYNRNRNSIRCGGTAENVQIIMRANMSSIPITWRHVGTLKFILSIRKRALWIYMEMRGRPCVGPDRVPHRVGKYSNNNCKKGEKEERATIPRSILLCIHCHRHGGRRRSINRNFINVAIIVSPIATDILFSLN